VVATAWPIGDRAAARQMEGFYGALAEGASVAEALTRMKRREIAAGAPPSEWAVFQLLGDPRARLADQVR
jgi:CHAT domain-containing protein